MLISPASIKKIVSLLSGHSGLIVRQNKSFFDDIITKKLNKKELYSKYDDFFEEYPKFKNNIRFKKKDFKLESYITTKIEEMNGTIILFNFIECLIKEIPLMFYKKETKDTLLEVFEYLNVEFSKDNYEIVEIEEDSRFLIYSLDGSMVSYGCYFNEQEIGQYALIKEHYDKCIKKVNEQDYSGAITNSLSLLEQILREIEYNISPNRRRSYDGKFVPLFKRVLQKLQITKGLDGKILKAYSSLGKGSLHIANGLVLIRHGMSDAHSISDEPTKKDALLAVNASKTLANFIVEHYFENQVRIIEDYTND